MSWKVSATAHREFVKAVLEAHDDDEIVLSGREVNEVSGEWVLEAWLEEEPTAAQIHALQAYFPKSAPHLVVEELAEQDWVTLSQAGMEPIRAGRFHVRTPDHPSPDGMGLIDLVIPASQAFGTGQHATTEGCLAMLNAMERLGFRPRNIIDVGTGTGLLAFAALRLWPEARITASDIDPVCEDVLRENAALNGVRLGPEAGQVDVVIAAGLEHPAIISRAPYDLLIANILAGPLIDLAPHFAEHLAAEGNVILSGLLTGQQEQVVAAYEQAGFRLSEANAMDDWAILRLCKTAPPADT